MLYTVDLDSVIDQSMKDYYKNRVKCRRQLLLEQFEESDATNSACEPLCQCCDICESVCICDFCNQ